MISAMPRETYAAARTVSPKVEAYFARRRTEADSHSQEQLAALPEAEIIEAVIDVAFWASLRREEGYMPRISLAFLSPEQTVHPLLFERPLPLDPAALTRVAPAVERPGVHLGVWRDPSGLCVWGTCRAIPKLCFVLEVAAPGLLVVKHHSGEEAGKFVNVAVLEGDQIKVVDEHALNLPDCPALLTSLLGFDSPTSWTHSVNVLVQLAVSMRAHGRGGCLLVVPAGLESWRRIDCAADALRRVAGLLGVGSTEPGGPGGQAAARMAGGTGPDDRGCGRLDRGRWRRGAHRPI